MKSKNSGFTLTEVLVALVIGVISIAAAFASYGYFNKSYQSISQKAAINNIARESLSILTKELRNGMIFCEIEEGFPDGMAADVYGNLFICDPHGQKIHIYEESGNLIGTINVPERVANCTFGGENNSLLYITASTSLYLLETGTTGK